MAASDRARPAPHGIDSLASTGSFVDVYFDAGSLLGHKHRVSEPLNVALAVVGKHAPLNKGIQDELLRGHDVVQVSLGVLLVPPKLYSVRWLDQMPSLGDAVVRGLCPRLLLFRALAPVVPSPVNDFVHAGERSRDSERRDGLHCCSARDTPPTLRRRLPP